MSKDRKSSVSDHEEYQYADESIVHEAEVEPVQLEPRQGRRFSVEGWLKKLGVLVLVVVAILAVYYYLGRSSTSKKLTSFTQEQTQNTSTQASVDSAPEVKSVAKPEPETPQPVSKPAAFSVSSASANADGQLNNALVQSTIDLEKEVIALNHMQKQSRNQIQQLQEQMVQTQTALSSLQQTVNATRAAVSGLDAKVSKLTVKPRAVAAVESKSVAQVVFHLKAVVPGRAWVQSTNGELLTVKVGDPLPSHGRVTGIDADQGIVTTSSGREIQYGPNDS